MYKNPELSKMAKILKSELASKEVLVSHAQAMDLAAKMLGSKNLHIAQAQANAAKNEPNLDDFAVEQAAQWMFVSLGQYSHKVAGLMTAIKNCFLHDHSRAIEGAVHNIFGVVNGPVLKPEIEAMYKVEELPELFASKVDEVKRLALKLQSFGATPLKNANGEDSLFIGGIQDWQVSEGVEDLREDQKRVFNVELSKNGSQFFMNLSLPFTNPSDIDNTDQLSLFIEINEGVPCVHLSNSLFGDQVLSVFATKEGLYLRPADLDLAIACGVPPSPGLREIFEREVGMAQRPFFNHAFILAQHA